MLLNKIIVTGIFVSAAMAGTLAYAQVGPGFEQGSRILTLSGGGSSDQDFDSSTASIQLGMGHFFTDNLAVGVRQDLNVADINTENDWNASTRLGLDFYPMTDRFAPYIGASIGYIYGDVVKDQFIAGPNVGVRYFVNDTTFLTLGLEYQFLFADTDEAQDAYKDGRYVYELGMGVRW